MAGKKGKSGGKRPGAGRPSLNYKGKKKLVQLSDQAANSLEYYSKELGISMSDIVDSLCVMYLDTSNKDITHCPKCKKPLVWEALVPMTEFDVECTCGYVAYIGE